MSDLRPKADESLPDLTDLFSADYKTSYDLAMNSPIIKEIARERARDEIVRYMIEQINLETNGVSCEDALDNWEHYKELHNIEVGD